MYASSDRAYISVKLAQQRATDLVLVASPNGPHLRLLKQCMALVVFSLRPIDRLAIVTYSSAAARVFPLRRMTSYGKRAAQQVIDRLFYMGQADPVEGLKKGIKILQDRVYQNPDSSILHLSDTPTRSYHAALSMDVPIPVHRFHVGFGFGTSNGFIIHEFEEFLRRLIGGVVREIHYIEDGEIDEPITTGETMVSIGDGKSNLNAAEAASAGSGTSGPIISGRPSSAESWDYHDPYMARRWAKHLHGYKL
ncbi:hypothetical protein M0R45_012689 [Rubus argutus]|uniref:VWFA domain-containing protein n=1 Tax=Rubus argutus TaxID=59490 RepID=A0AAW1XFZ6_RUBAR